jgi:hypothetical protein
VLLPSDLDRDRDRGRGRDRDRDRDHHLIPPDADPLAWAEEHLRVAGGYDYWHLLVPAQDATGRCHWLDEDNRCAVHEHSPWECAFYSAHLPPETVREMFAYDQEVRRQDYERYRESGESLYLRICQHLGEAGLVVPIRFLAAARLWSQAPTIPGRH